MPIMLTQTNSDRWHVLLLPVLPMPKVRHRVSVTQVIFSHYSCVDIQSTFRGGSLRMIFTRVETMKFGIFIITQIVCVIVNFKSVISTISRVHIMHISAPTSFECLGIGWGTHCF